jgi:hypothetical protein
VRDGLSEFIREVNAETKTGGTQLFSVRSQVYGRDGDGWDATCLLPTSRDGDQSRPCRSTLSWTSSAWLQYSPAPARSLTLRHGETQTVGAVAGPWWAGLWWVGWLWWVARWWGCEMVRLGWFNDYMDATGTQNLYGERRCGRPRAGGLAPACAPGPAGPRPGPRVGHREPRPAAAAGSA